MGWVGLSSKKTRRIAADTNQEVLWASGHGGRRMEFVTVDHRHGWWDTSTREWGWIEPSEVNHFDTCYETFGPWRG